MSNQKSGFSFTSIIIVIILYNIFFDGDDDEKKVKIVNDHTPTVEQSVKPEPNTDLRESVKHAKIAIEVAKKYLNKQLKESQKDLEEARKELKKAQNNFNEKTKEARINFREATKKIKEDTNSLDIPITLKVETPESETKTMQKL